MRVKQLQRDRPISYVLFLLSSTEVETSNPHTPTETTVITQIICFSAILTPSVDTARVAEIILAAFTFPIVLLRFISRAFIAKKLWWDDYLMMLSMVLFQLDNLDSTLWDSQS